MSKFRVCRIIKPDSILNNMIISKEEIKSTDTPTPSIVPPHPEPEVPINTKEGHTVPLNTIEIDKVTPFVAIVRINKLTMKPGYKLIAQYAQRSEPKVARPVIVEDKFGNYVYTVNRYRTELYTIRETQDNFALGKLYVVNSSDEQVSDIPTLQVNASFGNPHDTAWPGITSTFEAGSNASSYGVRDINDQNKMVVLSAWDFDNNNIQVKSGSTTIGEYFIALYMTDKGKELLKSNPNILGPERPVGKFSAGNGIVGVKDFSQNPDQNVRDNFSWVAVKINRELNGMPYIQSNRYIPFADGTSNYAQLTTQSIPSSNDMTQAKQVEILNSSLHAILPKSHPDNSNMKLDEGHMWEMGIAPNGKAVTPPLHVKVIG